MRKSAPFQIACKLRGTLTDNGFKQVQIAYLAVINNLGKLVQLSKVRVQGGAAVAKASVILGAAVTSILSNVC